MKDPKIYLGIDNCFASKRWTEPEEWERVIKDLGLYYVEASADTECDPLYMGAEYLADWCEKVKAAKEKTGVSVANLYSGHGTYATLGLAHTDARVRARFLNDWLKPMAKTASTVGAGLGFFCHAFSDSTLQDPARYEFAYNTLISDLANLAAYSKEVGCTPIGVEQMYSPHQAPWTVDGAKEMIRAIYKIAGAPLYITVDTGHQSGQFRFTRPTEDETVTLLNEKKAGKPLERWLGPATAYALYDSADGANASTVSAMQKEFDKYPYMFAEKADSDTYRWLSNLGDMSPIIHLQQTNGVSSSHLPFTPECNAKGIIKGEKVLRAIAEAYSQKRDADMPEQCNEITLTLEMFTGMAAINRSALENLKITVEYWRRFIPNDGMKLSEIIGRLK